MHDEFERALTGRPAGRRMSPFGWILLGLGFFVVAGTVVMAGTIVPPGGSQSVPPASAAEAGAPGLGVPQLVDHTLQVGEPPVAAPPASVTAGTTAHCALPGPDVDGDRHDCIPLAAG